MQLSLLSEKCLAYELGGQEHRGLKLSQLKRSHNPDHYIYYENTFKSRNGFFKQLRVKGKVVPIFHVQREVNSVQ